MMHGVLHKGTRYQLTLAVTGEIEYTTSSPPAPGSWEGDLKEEEEAAKEQKEKATKENAAGFA